MINCNIYLCIIHRFDNNAPDFLIGVSKYKKSVKYIVIAWKFINDSIISMSIIQNEIYRGNSTTNIWKTTVSILLRRLW